jgi:hypothetical protein
MSVPQLLKSKKKKKKKKVSEKGVSRPARNRCVDLSGEKIPAQRVSPGQKKVQRKRVSPRTKKKSNEKGVSRRVTKNEMTAKRVSLAECSLKKKSRCVLAEKTKLAENSLKKNVSRPARKDVLFVRKKNFQRNNRTKGVPQRVTTKKKSGKGRYQKKKLQRHQKKM